MTEIPETRESLMVRLHDAQDRDAWDQFTDLYRPVVYRIARGRGLQDADAQDLAQQVLMSVARSIPSWQRRDDKRQFRRWLRKVAKNATLNALARGPKDVAAGGSAAMNRLNASAEFDASTSDQIDWEHRREVYRQASIIVRAEVSQSTWEIFARTVIAGESSELVASDTRKSIGAVYVARCRVMKRLRDAVERLQREIDHDA